MTDDRVLQRLKLRDLRILLAVTEAGSMAKAARVLATSQPAVSRAIADMETALGVTLLERGSQGVEPTPYGRALIKRGVAVFDELRQGVQEIQFIADPTVGEVRIGCTPLLASSFVPAVVGRLSQRFPRIVFHIVPKPAKAVCHELSERHVDLVLSLRLGAFAEERFCFEPLFNDRGVVVAGAQHPLVRRRGRIELEIGRAHV